MLNFFVLAEPFMDSRVAAKLSINITLNGSVHMVFNKVRLMRVYGIASKRRMTLSSFSHTQMIIWLSEKVRDVSLISC